MSMVWNNVGVFRGYATDTEAPVVAEYDGSSTSEGKFTPFREVLRGNYNRQIRHRDAE
jgi:hypothetical protein